MRWGHIWKGIQKFDVIQSSSNHTFKRLLVSHIVLRTARLVHSHHLCCDGCPEKVLRLRQVLEFVYVQVHRVLWRRGCCVHELKNSSDYLGSCILRTTITIKMVGRGKARNEDMWQTMYRWIISSGNLMLSQKSSVQRSTVSSTGFVPRQIFLHHKYEKRPKPGQHNPWPMGLDWVATFELSE